jgi:hypothetical protein
MSVMAIFVWSGVLGTILDLGVRPANLALASM